MVEWRRGVSQSEARRKAEEQEALLLEVSRLNQEVSNCHELKRQLSSDIRAAFTENRAITRRGLELRKEQLSEERGDSDPTDTTKQIRLQGQWDMLQSLLQMEAEWNKNLLTVKQKVVQMENEISSLANQPNPEE